MRPRISSVSNGGNSYSFFINLMNYYQLIGSAEKSILKTHSFFTNQKNFALNSKGPNFPQHKVYVRLLKVNMKNLILQEIKLLKKKNNIKAVVPLGNSKDDVLSEKSSVSGKNSKASSKSQSKISRSCMELFKGMKFCFPIVDLDLSPKRVEIITNSILLQGGIVINFQDKAIEGTVDYILVSPTARIESVLRKIQKRIKFRKIIDFNLVLNSMKQGVLLAIQKYTLYNNQKEGQELEQTITIAQAARKMTKKSNYQRIDYFSQKYDDKLEDHTDNQQEDSYQSLKEKSSSSIQEDKANLIKSCKKLLNYDKKPIQQVKKNMFLCEKSITQESIQQFSINKFICQQLMKLQRIYQSEKDVGRKIAYLKAVSVIKSLNFEINTQSDLQNVKGIGNKIDDKIKELIRTGRLQKLEKLQQSERKKAEIEFYKVWGIGPSKAQQLYKVGIKTIEQLKERTDLLNKNQRIGLKYYQDFLKKIPREKITKIFQLIKGIFTTMVDSIQNYNIEVCGSYRRGKHLCGDIDIIISRKDGYYQKKLLLDFILQLEKVGFLVDHLQFPSGMESRSKLSYMGVCKFEEEIHHRIDIKYYPMEEYAFALLYFTGSDMFNRSMRLYARKKGLQLSDHGAHPRREERSGVIWEKPIPICETQRDIFEFMQLQYKSPQQRQV